MKNIFIFILLIFSTVVFSTDSEVYEYKKDFIRDFSTIDMGSKYLLNEKFSNNQTKEIAPNLEFHGKPDKHINSHYKILAIDSKGGYLKIEATKTIDLRSLGSKLEIKTGIFYVAYK